MKRMNWALAAAGAIGCGMPAALAQPQIEVRIDSVIIENNHEHDFPLTEIGATVPLIVVVRNIGSEDLVFTNYPPIDMGGGFSEQFVLIQPPLEAGNKLSPNGSTAFRVDFAPTFEYYRLSTRLFLWTNDPGTLFAITVAGESFDPNAPSEPTDDATDGDEVDDAADGPSDPEAADEPGAPDEGAPVGDETADTDGETADDPDAASDVDSPSESDEFDDTDTAHDGGAAAGPEGDTEQPEMSEDILSQEGLCGFGVPFALFSGLLGLTATRRTGRGTPRA